MPKLKYNVEDYLIYERMLQANGKRYICGVDEVGRGPLAGPVSVCAVIMDLDNLIDGIKDSKKVSEKNKESLSALILERAISYSIIDIDERVIDKINILNATKMAMRQAVHSLNVIPDIVLIDAVPLKLEIETASIIRGDEISYSIAAASILAKVHRDNLMSGYHEKYPYYNFSKNKGYGTAEHLIALKNHGASEIHRKTFIKNILKTA